MPPIRNHRRLSGFLDSRLAKWRWRTSLHHIDFLAFLRAMDNPKRWVKRWCSTTSSGVSPIAAMICA